MVKHSQPHRKKASKPAGPYQSAPITARLNLHQFAKPHSKRRGKRVPIWPRMGPSHATIGKLVPHTVASNPTSQQTIAATIFQVSRYLTRGVKAWNKQ